LVHISDLAQRQNIPRKFLEQILLQLKGADLVRSKKGPHGGYSLARLPGEITVGEVFRLVEKSFLIYSGNGLENSGNQNGINRVDFFGVFSEVESAISSVIDNINFDQILKREAESLAREGQSHHFDI
jgi:Rrf2 family protein